MAYAESRAWIAYYVKNGLSGHLGALCESEVKVKGKDPFFIFWGAVASMLEGSYSEAIHLLDSIKTKREVELPTVAALLHAHKKCNVVDREEVAALEALLQVAEDRAPDTAAVHAAYFHIHTNGFKEAASILDSIQANANTEGAIQAQSARGLLLLSDPSQDPSAALACFENLDERRKKDLDVLMGMAGCFWRMKAFPQAKEILNKIIATYPTFYPALNEKVRVCVALGEWEMAVEVAQRARTARRQNPDALIFLALIYLARDGNFGEALETTKELTSALENTERNNPKILVDYAKPLARLAGRNEAMLKATLTMVGRARKLKPEDGAILNELGYEQSLLGRYTEALESFKQSLRFDESNLDAVQGIIYCQIKDGRIEDAEQQMEFLNVLTEGESLSSQMALLQAILSWKKTHDKESHVKLLNKTLKIHMENLKAVAGSDTLTMVQEVIHLNPDFLVEVAAEFLQYSSQGKDGDGKLIKKGITILQKVVKSYPGLFHAQLSLARAYFESKDHENASKALQQVVKLDQSCGEAHLMLARIALASGNIQTAAASLDQALSYDFSIKNSVSFMLVKAKVLQSSGNWKEALELLVEALKPAFGGRRDSQLKATERAMKLTQEEKAVIYIAIIELHTTEGNLAEAQKFASEAMDKFRGAPEEIEILIASSELAIKSNRIEAAIAMLQSVPKSSAAYVKAQTVKADVYLQHKRDKKLYIQCYKANLFLSAPSAAIWTFLVGTIRSLTDIVEIKPTVASYVQLGEACLKVQEPDQAIEAFQGALNLDSTDSTIADRLGEALLSTHDYLKAINYYDAALRMDPSRARVRHKVVELYIRLKKYEQARRVLEKAPSKSTDDIQDIIAQVKDMRLFSEILMGHEDVDRAEEVLCKSASIQKRVVDRLKSDQPELLKAQKDILTNIYVTLGEMFLERAPEKSIQYFNDSLRCDPSHEKTLMRLASLSLKMGEHEQCKHQCETLLRIVPGHDGAAIMLSDLSFQKGEFETATYYLQQILDHKKDQFFALSKLIKLLWRIGKLQDATQPLAAAENCSMRSAQLPGYFYCKGLYLRYKNDVVEAIKCFNKARRDAQFGADAVAAMIQLYLNPDSDNIWGDSSAELDPENLRVVEKLLGELPKNDTRRDILQAYYLLGSRNPASIEKAIQAFTDITEQKKDYIPSLLGMSVGYMLLKQEPRARNQLKRIAKMDYDLRFMDELEQSYLMLADIYIGSGKYDLAQELCQRCLKYNKACGRAWETMGMIMEKEQSYQDAASNYEKAWKLQGENSAPVGYKLAFNYLKARRNIEAITVCQKVLSAFPNYPKIREDILVKAREGLRP